MGIIILVTPWRIEFFLLLDILVPLPNFDLDFSI